jgi:hypothetical protein
MSGSSDSIREQKIFGSKGVDGGPGPVPGRLTRAPAMTAWAIRCHDLIRFDLIANSEETVPMVPQ